MELERLALMTGWQVVEVAGFGTDWDKDFEMRLDKDFEMRLDKDFEMRLDRDFEMRLDRDFEMRLDRDFEMRLDRDFDIDVVVTVEVLLKMRFGLEFFGLCLYEDGEYS